MIMDYNQEFAKIVTAINAAVSEGVFKSSADVHGIHVALHAISTLIQAQGADKMAEEKPTPKSKK